MIAVSEAKKLIAENCIYHKIIPIKIGDALDYVLAENIYAPFNSPHFIQSAMDGYAFNFDNWNGKDELTIVGEVQAGKCYDGPINKAEAVRIFTGAALPFNANTVVIQEHVEKKGNAIKILDTHLKNGINVRPIGSQTKQNELLLEKGHLLTPASIALLANFGIKTISVFSNPTISIITTGKELLQLNEELVEGKVYESNSFALAAVLKQMKITPTSIEMVDDDEGLIINAIKNTKNADILILTGGVSVGDYDFVNSALEKCGAIKIFHKVKQKPGKPFYFGKINHTLVFGLPGNPASVLSCFYMYVAEAVGYYTQKKYFKNATVTLAHHFQKKAGLTFFLKGKSDNNDVIILDNQESYKMNSFALANCLIELNPEKEFFEKGELVHIKLIV